MYVHIKNVKSRIRKRIYVRVAVYLLYKKQKKKKNDEIFKVNFKTTDLCLIVA